MTAKVKIQLTNRPIPLESFKDNKQLGRIMLRKGGETVAAGVVDEVTKIISKVNNNNTNFFIYRY